MTRAQLTDVEWELIEPYLPIGEYGPYPERLRQQFEGVIWRFKTGGQWREMPTEFGAWSTVHNRFRQWRDSGVFEAIMEGLVTEAAKRGEVDLSLVSIDSTTARAHHDAAGMHMDEDVLTALEKAAAETEKARFKRGDCDEQTGQEAEGDPVREERRRIRRRRKLRLKAALLGRSRGGQTSKIHVVGDRKCRPLAFILTAGQAADSPQFIPVLGKVRVRMPVGRPRTRPGAVAGDKAYSSCGNRAHLRKRRIKAVIPEKKDQAANRKKKGSRGGRPVSHDADLYKERNTVERLINKLKAWRGIATRYDKTPDSYLAGLHLRASMIWLRELTRTT
ncbi:IS5 family transposase [Streptomyces marianii]|uniref:IS5 family transposase n=1 Tax=Streptomyces marianii TaxID=1817406 RepID=A0A5R9EH37_9ACTN|nr:IS5 family transposase [Streptomyces marianii]TLQ47144.1 IS5 family transposase [Streptomyces marianii]